MHKSYWAEFCLLTPGERRYIVESCITTNELTDALAKLSSRPISPTLKNERLYLEAGRYADSYRGEGWLFLRGLLMAFHQHMKHIEELEKGESLTNSTLTKASLTKASLTKPKG